MLESSAELNLSGDGLSCLIKAALSKKACLRLKASGFSMFPFIRDGDILTIDAFQGRPRLGEVAAALHPVTEKLIIHRIVSKANGSYLLKGDNMFKPDGLFSSQDILGRVIRIEHKQRHLFVGLGPGRSFIAILSSSRLLPSLLLPVYRYARWLRSI